MADNTSGSFEALKGTAIAGGKPRVFGAVDLKGAAVAGGKPRAAVDVDLKGAAVAGGKPRAAVDVDLKGAAVAGGKPRAVAGVDLKGAAVAGGKPTPTVSAELSMPLSKPLGRQVIKRLNWAGLNRRRTVDSGGLSSMNNISTDETPYLVPCPKAEQIASGYTYPIGLFGFEDFLLVVYRSSGAIKIDYLRGGSKWSGNLKESGATSADDSILRSIVRFDVFDKPEDPLSGKFSQRLLIFPDCLSMNFNASNGLNIAALAGTKKDEDGNTITAVFPPIKWGAVHNSRLFGVDNDKVFASGFNDYANWNFDTADDYNTANAWFSPSQGSGKLLGVTTYGGHCICFKEGFIQEIYNNKNPFRLVDNYSRGTIDMRSVAQAEGTLFFADRKNIMAYTGVRPRIIDEALGLKEIKSAVAGAFGCKYYIYCTDELDVGRLFVYDALTGLWGQERVLSPVRSFASNNNGLYMLCANGRVYKLNTTDYQHDWSAETDLITGQTVDIKRIVKLQLLADMGSNSDLNLSIIYDDGSRVAEDAFSYSNTGGSTVQKVVRAIPRQTANYGFKVRVSGRGFVRLYQMEIFVSEGGELLD